MIRLSGLQSDVVFFKGYAEDIQQYIVFLMLVGEGGEHEREYLHLLHCYKWTSQL